MVSKCLGHFLGHLAWWLAPMPSNLHSSNAHETTKQTLMDTKASLLGLSFVKLLWFFEVLGNLQIHPALLEYK